MIESSNQQEIFDVNKITPSWRQHLDVSVLTMHFFALGIIISMAFVNFVSLKNPYYENFYFLISFFGFFILMTVNWFKLLLTKNEKIYTSSFDLQNDMDLIVKKIEFITPYQWLIIPDPKKKNEELCDIILNNKNGYGIKNNLNYFHICTSAKGISWLYIAALFIFINLIFFKSGKFLFLKLFLSNFSLNWFIYTIVHFIILGMFFGVLQILLFKIFMKVRTTWLA